MEVCQIIKQFRLFTIRNHERLSVQNIILNDVCVYILIIKHKWKRKSTAAPQKNFNHAGIEITKGNDIFIYSIQLFSTTLLNLILESLLCP